MFRYYSTQRPVAPGTFPGHPAAICNFDDRKEVSGVGLAWGYLDYKEQLDEGEMKAYELKADSRVIQMVVTKGCGAKETRTALQGVTLEDVCEAAELSVIRGYAVYAAVLVDGEVYTEMEA